MADRPTQSQAPKGHVIAQEETSGKDAKGRYVPGVDVTAQIDGTTATFTVFIPADAYTPEAVQAALEAKAAQVAAVHNLTFGGA